jgi:hypothetical protein
MLDVGGVIAGGRRAAPTIQFTLVPPIPVISASCWLRFGRNP